MKPSIYMTAGLAVAMGLLTGASPRLRAQGGPAKPAKTSFSNGPQTKAVKPAAGAVRHAAQEELIDAVLGDTMNKLWEQSDEHFHVGEYNHSIGLDRIVVQGDPHNMEAYSTAAWLFWSTARNDEAEAILQEGLAANPNNYYMYDEVGVYWLIERKDPKAAIPYYEKAIKFDCPLQTWNSLANCYEKTDQWEKAVGAWEKASLYPNNAIATVRLKRARTRLAQPKDGG